MTRAEVSALRKRLLDKTIPQDFIDLVAKLLDHALKVEQDRELLFDSFRSVERNLTPNAVMGR